MRLIQTEQIIFHSGRSRIFGFGFLLLAVVLYAQPSSISNSLSANLK